MALLNKTTDKNETTGTEVNTTDYTRNIARGVQYETQEEAIMANAKAYARKDFLIMKPALIEFGMSKEDIVKMAHQILAQKRSNIVNYLAKLEQKELEESELPF